MTTYVPISDAVSKFHVSNRDLLQLIQTGRIKSAYESTGGILVNADDVKAIPKEERPEYKQFIHLVGVTIGLGEASRKYNVSTVTISRWVKKGYIKKLGQDGQKVLVDEADVAYSSAVYRVNPGQGRWVFTSDGTPYAKKNC